MECTKDSGQVRYLDVKLNPPPPPPHTPSCYTQCFLTEKAAPYIQTSSCIPLCLLLPVVDHVYVCTEPCCVCATPTSTTSPQRGFQAIHIAAYNRKQPVVEYLIREERCSVDTPTSFRETPLHIACLRGPVSMVAFLLGCNADCTSRDSNGNSVLHHAAAGNQRDIVQSVLQHRAELMKAVNNVRVPAL